MDLSLLFNHGSIGISMSGNLVAREKILKFFGTILSLIVTPYEKKFNSQDETRNCITLLFYTKM